MCATPWKVSVTPGWPMLRLISVTTWSGLIFATSFACLPTITLLADSKNTADGVTSSPSAFLLITVRPSASMCAMHE